MTGFILRLFLFALMNFKVHLLQSSPKNYPKVVVFPHDLIVDVCGVTICGHNIFWQDDPMSNDKVTTKDLTM